MCNARICDDRVCYERVCHDILCYERVCHLSSLAAARLTTAMLLLEPWTRNSEMAPLLRTIIYMYTENEMWVCENGVVIVSVISTK